MDAKEIILLAGRGPVKVDHLFLLFNCSLNYEMATSSFLWLGKFLCNE